MDTGPDFGVETTDKILDGLKTVYLSLGDIGALTGVLADLLRTLPPEHGPQLDAARDGQRVFRAAPHRTRTDCRLISSGTAAINNNAAAIICITIHEA